MISKTFSNKDRILINKALCTDNALIKFADDADLLVPEISKVDVADEFVHIRK